MKKFLIFLSVLFFVSFNSGNVALHSGSLFQISSSQLSALESSSQKIEEGTHGRSSQVQKSAAANLLEGLPLYFVENKGQVDQNVRFQLKLSSMNAYFTSQEIVYQLIQHRGVDKAAGANNGESAGSGEIKSGDAETLESKGQDVTFANIRMSFPGMNEHAALVGLDESEAKVNYFIGSDPEKWISGAGTYNRVIYGELYPGIDLVVYGGGGKVKHEYRVKAGAKVEDIQIMYEGIEGLWVNGEGELEVDLIGGTFKEGVPVSYQMIDGERVEVESAYRIIDENVIGFRMGEYVKDRELIIDPELSYSTFLGGSNMDFCCGIAIDGSGNAYVTGYTYSSDFPTTPGAYDTSHNGSVDVFITKLNSTGSALSYSTYLGGSGNDSGLGIAVDGSGNAYVTGGTSSTDFPTTPGAYDTGHNGSEEVFITKLNSTGSALTYSTFLGGSVDEVGYGIAVDGSGNAYVGGYTGSTDFPTTAGAYDTSHNGDNDAFITKLNSAGTSLSYSTYLGGSSHDLCFGIALDGNSNAYVTGYTFCGFPTTVGAYDISCNGNTDVFITKVNSTGTSLSYSTYLGGVSFEEGRGIAVDGYGNAYVTGITLNPGFPTTAGAYDISYNGDNDAFITKVNPSGSDLSYSTYLGGGSTDFGWAIAVDGYGNAYVAGQTYSPDFPTTSGAYSTSNNGGADGFVTKVDQTGSDLSYSTYLGGSGLDYCAGIAVDAYGYATITGITGSANFPTTAGAYDTVYNSAGDNFVAKLFTGLKDDLLGTWASQGVYSRNSDTGAWVKLAGPAAQITAGDFDNDETDDLIGIWPSDGGVWVKYSGSGNWALLSSTPDWIGAGDMNGDGRDELISIWPGQGVYCRDSVNGHWMKMATPATQITAGDLDNDGTDDLIGIWPSEGGVWVKYGGSGNWARLSSTADWIGAGDMNGDGRDDLIGSWLGQGVFCKDSASGGWVKMATPASQVTCGDLDGDGTGDLVGIWPGQGGVWVKNSDSSTWRKLSSAADWIACGRVRGAVGSLAMLYLRARAEDYAEAPGHLADYEDLSGRGPGGWNFVPREEANLVPTETEPVGQTRIPGPGEPGFTCIEQQNLIPLPQRTREDRKRKNTDSACP